MDPLLCVILTGLATPLWLPLVLWWMYGARARALRPVVQVGVEPVAVGSYRAGSVPVMAAVGMPAVVTLASLVAWAVAGALVTMLLVGWVMSAELTLRVYMNHAGPSHQMAYFYGTGLFGVLGLVVSVGLVRAGASLLEASPEGSQRAHSMGGWLMVYQGLVALFGVAAYTGTAERPSPHCMGFVFGYWVSVIGCALLLCHAASVVLAWRQSPGTHPRGRGLWFLSSR